MNHFTWRLESYLKPTKFLRFLLVGMINTLLGLSVIFMFLHVFDQGYWISTFFGNAAGMICSYLLNRSFTFKSTISFWKGGSTFFLASGICYFFSYWLAEKIVIITSDHYLREIAVLVGMIFYTLSNYLAQKYFVFHKNTVS